MGPWFRVITCGMGTATIKKIEKGFTTTTAATKALHVKTKMIKHVRQI